MASQLALIGEQDLFLSGNPTHTLWSSVWKRSTLFSMESINQPFNGDASLGRKCNVVISRSGDLLHTIYLQLQVPDLSDFSINRQAVPEQNRAVIVSARWTSASSARVKYLVPTDGISSDFEPIVTDGDGLVVSDVEVTESGFNTMIITGLDKSKTYTVQINRVVDSSVSEPERIVCLRWSNALGNAMLRKVSLHIGGTMISEATGEYYDIANELEMTNEKFEAYSRLIGKFPEYDLFDNSIEGGTTLFVPINMTFFKEASSAIPLISLAFHQVQLFFDFRSYSELIKSDVNIVSLMNTNGKTPESDFNIELYSTFIYLSQPERQRFLAQDQKLEYLFHDIQAIDVPLIVNSNSTNLNKKINFVFNNPCVELLWTYTKAERYNNSISTEEYCTKGNDYFRYDIDGSTEIFDYANLQINGVDRQSRRPGLYYKQMEPYLRHSRTSLKDIFCFSFALQPENLQPSGSLNFSRVERSDLLLTLNSKFLEGVHSGKITIFSKSLNILRIENGLAGVLFAS